MIFYQNNDLRKQISREFSGELKLRIKKVQKKTDKKSRAEQPSNKTTKYSKKCSYEKNISKKEIKRNVKNNKDVQQNKHPLLIVSRTVPCINQESDSLYGDKQILDNNRPAKLDIAKVTRSQKIKNRPKTPGAKTKKNKTLGAQSSPTQEITPVSLYRCHCGKEYKRKKMWYNHTKAGQCTR